MRKVAEPSPDTVTDHLRACNRVAHLRSADRESFYAIHLDVRNHVIGVEEVSKGTLSGVEVHPRELFKGAILNNASKMIIAHNHPSGIADASREDIALTERIGKAGEMLGIPLLDHVIVAGSKCTSIRNDPEAGRHVPWGGYEAVTPPAKKKKRKTKAE